MRRKTNEDFLKELNQVNPNVTPLNDYINSSTKIEIRCNVCNNIWRTTPKDLLRGSGCPSCYSRSRIKTKEEFERDVHKVHGNSYKVLSYINTSEKALMFCNECQKEFKTNPKDIVRGTGCPHCSGNIKMSLDEFKLKFNELNNNIEILEDVTQYNKRVLVRCKECGAEFLKYPKQLLNSYLCKDNCRISRDKSKYLNSNYYHKFDFKFKEPLKHQDEVGIQCKDCGNSFTKTFQTIYQNGLICRNCNPTGSMAEEELSNIISENIEVVRNKLFNFGNFNLELDIFIPKLNIGIEYDGNYWHSDKNLNHKKIINKKKLFMDRGIRVIFIREDEYLNKKEIVLDKIFSILGLNKIRIGARKLKIKNVSKDVSDVFLEKYHIQGKDNSSIRIGLYTPSGKLVSLMTFGRVRAVVRSLEDYEKDVYELIRYASRNGVNVSGGFSRLLKHSEKVLKDIGVSRIKTFADRRWSSDKDNVYIKNGFTLKHISGQNYVYIKNGEAFSRVRFQKHRLKEKLENFDENLSEYDNMSNNGYLRVWDCGNLVYYKDII